MSGDENNEREIMKNFGKAGAILAICGLAMGVCPTQANATGSHTYVYTFSGNLCHASVFGPQPNHGFSKYGVHNTSSADFLEVTCPMTFEVNQFSTTFVRSVTLGALDRHTTKAITCGVVKADLSTGAFQSISAVFTSTGGANAPFSSPSATFNYGPLVQNVNGNWFLDCMIPPVEAGTSHLQSYSVTLDVTD